MEEKPTNRELKIMLDNQSEKFAEKHEDLMRVARETRDNVKEIVIQTQKTNGRVSNLESWSKEAQKIIESTTDIANKTLTRYRSDRVRIWTAITMLTLLGGVVITLAIAAINSKIKDGIDQALSSYDKIIINNQ